MGKHRASRQRTHQRTNARAHVAVPFVRMGFPIRARYDSAQTTDDNSRHWANADYLSADAAHILSIRSTLRNRARYEVANNTYAKGLMLTIANDCVGTVVRLQVRTSDPDLNRNVEQQFAAWAKRVHLAAKLRTMRMAKATDGETFAILGTNDHLDHPVQLDLRLIEADQVTSDQSMEIDNRDVDGVLLNPLGNVVGYRMLEEHPGDIGWYGIGNRYVDVPRSAMVHWFRADRPGQHRGIPEITPALPLFAQLRRYTLATLDAAETAANFAGVLQTTAPADGAAVQGTPFESVPLERNMITSLPDGWTLGQMDAKQPTTTYREFKAEILNEIFRCLLVPRNIGAGDSSGYNYASGRLDHQTYFRAILIERQDMADIVLDPLLAAWKAELQLATEFTQLRRLADLPHEWFFEGFAHVDPEKEANAERTRLESRTLSYARAFASQGRDVEEEFAQIAIEQERMRELNIVPAQIQPASQPASTPSQEMPPDETQE